MEWGFHRKVHCMYYLQYYIPEKNFWHLLLAFNYVNLHNELYSNDW